MNQSLPESPATQVVVVGAGPMGLAAAYYLHRRRISYRVLERRSVGYAWLNHYDSVRLHTLKQVSALPGLEMPDDFPVFPTARQVQCYLQDYATHFKLRIDTGVDVLRASYGAGIWRLQTSAGEITCQTLLIATGIWSTPYRPAFPGLDEFGGCVIHSRDYRNPQTFTGQRVLVVGIGNSGAEIAVELSNAGIDVGISVRSGVTFVPYPRSAVAMRLMAWSFRNLPRPIGEKLLGRVRRDFGAIGLPRQPGSILDAFPVVGFELPATVAARKVTVHAAVRSVTPEAVVFADGSTEPYDAVILATGYRPTIGMVSEYVDCDPQGHPKLQRWRSRRNPNLFCIGFTYPTTEGLLQSTGRVAREAVAQIESAK